MIAAYSKKIGNNPCESLLLNKTTPIFNKKNTQNNSINKSMIANSHKNMIPKTL